jgi:hypothetical protein
MAVYAMAPRWSGPKQGKVELPGPEASKTDFVFKKSGGWVRNGPAPILSSPPVFLALFQKFRLTNFLNIGVFVSAFTSHESPITGWRRAYFFVFRKKTLDRKEVFVKCWRSQG